MKRQLSKTIALAGIIAALGMSAQATPITGVIGFSGEATLDTSSVLTSSEVLSWGANTIGITSGTFSTLDAAAVVALSSPWLFNGGSLNDFWRVTDDGNSYTFNLTSSSVVGTTARSITVALVGTVISSITGLDPTTFNGTFTIQNPPVDGNGVFRYTESMSFGAAAASAPDGGNTALLLGSGLVGLAFIRRKAAGFRVH